MVATLQSSLSRFVSQNNKIYYNCFGSGAVQIVKINSETTLYVIKGPLLPIYLKNRYNVTNFTA